jgi:hypothetical protein
MSYDQNAPRQADEAPYPRLRPKRVVVSLADEKMRLICTVLYSDSPIFLDTNILLWSFGLNEDASRVWQKWLLALEERLVIPAWVLHEYNQLSGKPEIFSPYKALTKKLQVVLDELRDSTARALDGAAAAAGLGCPSKNDLERKLTEASEFILSVAKSVSRNDSGHRIELLKFYEQLLTKRCLSSDVHELSRQASAEFDARSAGRLSPGAEDAGKPQNRCGDLIIWKEILQYCAQARKGGALFISNDVKVDWCYKPVKVVLENGKEVSWSSEVTRDLRLPNPELLAEFHRHTGDDGLLFATIQQVVETFSSTNYSALDAAVFSHLAQATQSNRTPTDRVVDWIHNSEELYEEGSKVVAGWERSTGELDLNKFKTWCREKLKDSGIPFEKVAWGSVFFALYM